MQDRTVVPNDFHFKNDKNGTLIIGENGSGKTVYLRSIASSYILANAGLPIPAENAVIELPTGIFVMMASSERALERAGQGGRFESEVSDLSDFVRNVESGSFVFLNEIFQSTSYDEGADALYSVLDHFSNERVKWILVTHLEQMIPMFESEASVIIQKTAKEDGFRFSFLKQSINKRK
jgi:DNA mismatch repair ATPase MutS